MQTDKQTSKQTYDALDKTIINPCKMFLDVAKDSGLKDEQAIVSLMATMFIRYNNLCDKNVHFNELLKSLKASAEKSGQVTEDLLLMYYDPLIRSSKRIGDKVSMFIKEKSKEPMTDFKAFDEALRDYVYRNGFEFEYICTLSPVINKED